MAGTFPKLAISLFVTLGLLGLAEVAIRLAGIQPQNWPSADGRRFPQVRIDPLLGPLPQPSYSGSWFGFPVEIDDEGFRSTGLSPPGSGARRVAFVGDSCTFGWGLTTNETFVAQMDALQRVAGEPFLVLRNSGYPGQSAVVGEYIVRELLLPWNPDVVVIGFSGNNAFRLTLAPHVDRFKMFEARKVLFRSRLLHILASYLANRREPPGHPRNRDAVQSVPLETLHRVANVEEFSLAVRNTIKVVRADGGEPLLLIFPRASQVSDQYAHEDAARAHAVNPLRRGGNPKNRYTRELGLLESSCIDLRSTQDPLNALHERIGRWKPVYPSSPELKTSLRVGAQFFVRGELDAANEIFETAVASAPNSPLAQYDVGVSRIALGRIEEGLRALDEASSLACNVFLQYQVRLRHIAVELDVTVIDLMMHFQSHEGGRLYIDPAHPSPAGAALIAEALWSELGTRP